MGNSTSQPIMEKQGFADNASQNEYWCINGKPPRKGRMKSQKVLGWNDRATIRKGSSDSWRSCRFSWRFSDQICLSQSLWPSALQPRLRAVLSRLSTNQMRKKKHLTERIESHNGKTAKPQNKPMPLARSLFWSWHEPMPKKSPRQKTGYPLCLDNPEACGQQFPITQYSLDRTTMTINDFRKLKTKPLKQEANNEFEARLAAKQRWREANYPEVESIKTIEEVKEWKQNKRFQKSIMWKDKTQISKNRQGSKIQNTDKL